MAGDFALAYSLAKFIIISFGIPVTPSAHSGVYCFNVSLNSSYPSAFSNKNCSSCRFSLTMTFIIESANAPSVPGFINMTWSQYPCIGFE